MDKQRILITGGTGFVGKAVVKKSLLEGHKVGLLVRPSKILEKNVANQKELAFFPADPEGIETAFDQFNPQVIIHLATCYGRNGEGVKEIFEVNYELPMVLLKKALETQVQRYLNADTFFIKNII